MTSTGAIITYLLLINVATYLAFGLDKYFAIKGMWRISEVKLLFLSLIGGSGGGFAGSRMFRHKTQKEPFRSYFRVLIASQLLASAVYFVPPLRVMASGFVDFIAQ